MAKLAAIKDQAAKYAYFRSVDGYNLPGECRDLIKRNGGDFNGDTHDWRVVLHRAAEVIATMRAWGHDVTAIDSAYQRPVKRAKECQGCGAGVRADFVPDGTVCKRCGEVLAPIAVGGGAE